MPSHLRIIKFLPTLAFSHLGKQRPATAGNHHIRQHYPRKMDVTRKRHWNPDIGVESEILESLSRPISPPRKRKRAVQMMKSPWQLTRIRDLPPEVNKDAVTLQDVLGDPLIYECWQFNFLHSIPFILDAFDPSVRHTVQLHIVHGFWERNDLCRIILAVSGSFCFLCSSVNRPLHTGTRCLATSPFFFLLCIVMLDYR